MIRQHLVIDLPSTTLALFDPDQLQHRRAEAEWMKDRAQVKREMEAGALLTFGVGERRVAIEVCAEDSPDPAGGPRLEVRSGHLFAGDLTEVPSARWGKRRWNIWDLVFAAMLASVPPFLVWLSGMGENIAQMTGAMALLTIAMSVPFTWLVFRGKSEFAGRSGLPPIDSPHQVVDVPPGSYAARFEPTAHGMRIRLCPVR